MRKSADGARDERASPALHASLVHTLGRRIVSGDIRPGDSLRAGSTPAASRTALREAIRVLTGKGLLESRPRVGTKVSARESWNMLDPDVLSWQCDGTPHRQFLDKLTELRALIEPQAAALAAERADHLAVAALEWALHDMATAVSVAGDDGIRAFAEADMRFHLALARACGNELVEHITRVVYSGLARAPYAHRLPRHPRRSVPKHRALFRAIADRQPVKAGAAMRRLVDECQCAIQC